MRRDVNRSRAYTRARSEAFMLDTSSTSLPPELAKQHRQAQAPLKMRFINRSLPALHFGAKPSCRPPRRHRRRSGKSRRHTRLPGEPDPPHKSHLMANTSRTTKAAPGGGGRGTPGASGETRSASPAGSPRRRHPRGSRRG